MVREISAHYRP
jgi:hypothetical protein